MTRMNALKAATVLGTLVALPILTNGCSAASTISSVANSDCNGSVDAKAFAGAVTSLTTIQTNLEQSVLTACTGMSNDLVAAGVTAAAIPAGGSGDSVDSQVTAACNAAAAGITAVINGGGSASVTCGLAVSGGGCQVSVSAAATCEASCTASGSCTPPTVPTCSSGELQGSCTGSCTGTCQGSVSAPVADCSGSCSGECDGTCVVNGNSSQVKGACAGTCTGSCTGGCTVTGGGASASCSGTCQGSCSVAFTAPSCTGQVAPPSCNADASCSGSCQAQASASATCTPPTVSLDCGASASAEVTALTTTVAKNFPAIIAAVQTQGPLALSALQTIATTGASLGGDAVSCTSQVAAGATASVSVSVSIKASASVSTSAGGPGAS